MTKTTIMQSKNTIIHPLCGCLECKAEVAEMVRLVDRRQRSRDGEIESLIDIAMKVIREHEKSKD